MFDLEFVIKECMFDSGCRFEKAKKNNNILIFDTKIFAHKSSTKTHTKRCRKPKIEQKNTFFLFLSKTCKNISAVGKN